ncbi:MAG: helix-turn-helix domain-containing protein [Casimicrobiaceae bacterium]
MTARSAASTKVKSAVRVLEVFEYFDQVQREASVSEIARALGYPASSTSVLLHSLAEIGYVEQDARRMYRPTPRVTLLGAWIDRQLAPEGPVLQLMGELGEATGETIILAVQSGQVVRYIHVVPATKSMRLHLGPGTIRPLATSGLGRLFMAMMPDEDVRHAVFRHNASQADDQSRLSLATVRRDIQAIQSAGYAVSVDRVSPGAGVVAVALPRLDGRPPMGIGIGGLSKTIRANAEAFATMIKAGIRRHIGGAKTPRRAA